MKAEFSDLFKTAQQYLAAGQFDRAESACAQAIDLEPSNAEARSLLGLIAVRQGRHEQAVDRFRAAIDCEPLSPVFHNNLGAAYLDTGQLDRARACFEKAIDCQADYVFAHKNLGRLHEQRGDAEAAIACFREALARNPQYAPAYQAWGNLLYSRGELPAAAAQYEKALVLQDDPGTRFRLAIVLDGMGHHRRAVELFQQIEAATPNYPGLQHNLGRSFSNLGQPDMAIACFEKASALNPGDPLPLNSCGNVYTSLGRPDEAIRWFRRALELDPDYPTAHSNLMLNMNYLDDEQENIVAEAKAFDARQTKNLAGRLPPFKNSRTVSKKLRIGYVSGDFRSHSVAYFALPLLETLNRKQFEIYCYSNNLRQDEVTEQFKSIADGWTMIRGMSDDVVAEQIRGDEVDVLVDLAGHTSDNRLLVFARKPAPVLVSWLGYPNTTGLKAMDYRITDAIADPDRGESDNRYTEQLIRLPSGFLCYRNDERSPPVSDPPNASNGYVTFGSFNVLGKVTPKVIDTWSEILAAVPDSRLIMKSQSLEHEKAKAFLTEQFHKHHVEPDRLELTGLLPKAEHLDLYSRVDVALDTFPYNGTTTTCESLWMGVPVITLEGNYHAGRVGASILQRIGLTDLIARDRASYVGLAKALAGDAGRLAALRENLREQMGGSELMNQSVFAKNMEDAYRRIWAGWCHENA